MAGYSGTPLAKKLGIKPGSTVVVESPPVAYERLLSAVPPGVRFQSTVDASTDLVHLFSTSKADLADALRNTLRRLRPDAVIWASWPKKASSVPTDITEDTIREVALPPGLVDIKVCAVNDVWSGLKLVLRKANRPVQAGAARRRGRSKNQ